MENPNFIEEETSVIDTKNNKIILSDLLHILGDVSIEKYNSQEISKDIIENLQITTNDGFGINLSYDDIYDHITGSDETFVVRHNNEIIGFTSIKKVGDFYYLFGTAIRKDFHGKGIQTSINKKIFKDVEKVFLRTQNKNMIKSCNIPNKKILVGKEAYTHIVSELGEQIFKEFFHGDLGEEGVFKGAYGGLFGKKGNVDFVDGKMYEGFDASRGDSLLVLMLHDEISTSKQ